MEPRGAWSNAARYFAEVVDLDQRRVQLGYQAHQDQADQLALETAAADVNDALDALSQSTSDAVDAQNRLSTWNQSAALYNQVGGRRPRTSIETRRAPSPDADLKREGV